MTKIAADVVEVEDHGLVVKYDPYAFDVSQEIEGPQGWLRILDHQPGSIKLSQDASVEVGGLLTQHKYYGGVKAVKDFFEAFADLWKPIWTKHAETPPDRWNLFVARLKAEVPKPTDTCNLPPITTEEWIKAVQSKK